ncbi:MAG TPA: nucleoside monophosphate kinase [Candidatus Cloacimonas sp.]|jgi:adenylate kinase|nr:nucleoside monophosphate kinase [Candidatus Cloacimonas sp.]MDD2249507.1 nucleoside monophosphate kinase [Candidatus Cloacimonadota bacterium]MDD3733395.1 nucleoside monophosphate kinase [Candidatus Cloacimonadota bacterium]MDD3869114.1 nucleoside monophosphate kinase [Candidatus Cloacimonadota bacterium]MDD4675997.1 nucleoside monophosphate kinase [Candidatus Cloacimonadota bacterium]
MIDVIVFLGIQGSGKGTQAELLAEKTGFQHINIGDLFREQISKQTELGKKVQSIIAKGELVNDELVFELVNSSLSTSCPGVIFDGFPRTQAQAEYLLQHYNVLRVYYLELTETEAIERIEARRLCSSCGATYNILHKKPTREGICDVCGSSLIQRTDDNGEAVRKRVKEFYKQTFALKEYFEVMDLLKEIPARDSIEIIQQKIITDLQTKLKIN